jgi:hypothetical protein
LKDTSAKDRGNSPPEPFASNSSCRKVFHFPLCTFTSSCDAIKAVLAGCYSDGLNRSRAPQDLTSFQLSTVPRASKDQ